MTLFNCFNQNSFGQLFVPSVSGSLTALSMPMTCLNPAAATPPVGLFALLYETTNSGLGLPSVPLATAPVDLSTCPTLTSWQNHTFSAADFATIALNFTGVTLTAGHVYGVFFSGLAPGTPPPGTPTVTSVTPSSGALVGGESVSITGTNLTGATSVTFGGVAATSFSVVSDTSITATVPSGVSAGAVSVIVTTPNGANIANSLFTFSPAPVPTLGQWGMILMALLLAAAGVVAVRRRRIGATSA